MRAKKGGSRTEGGEGDDGWAEQDSGGAGERKGKPDRPERVTVFRCGVADGLLDYRIGGIGTSSPPTETGRRWARDVSHCLVGDANAGAVRDKVPSGVIKAKLTCPRIYRGNKARNSLWLSCVYASYKKIF